MIEEKAIVSRVTDGQVWLKGMPSSACCGCAQQSGCATAALANAMPKRELKIDCDLSLKVGEKVTVGINDSHLLLASFQLYLLPLLVMFVGLIVTDPLLARTGLESLLLPTALLCLFVGFWLVRHWHRNQTNANSNLQIFGKE